MRFFVTAVAMGCASCIIVAQTKADDTPVQKPAVLPQAPPKRIRRAPAPGPVSGTAKPATVPASAPVVTLQGICKERQAKSTCETVITRGDLDGFVAASVPDASEAARNRLAVQYARTLALSALAEQQGLEKNLVLAKELDEQIKLVRMRILADAFLQNLQRQATIVPESEIQAYYEAHKDQYEQAQVRRVAIPALVPTENGRPLDRAAVKTEMGELRSRAVAGEDLDQLQQDAYKHLHIQAMPPSVAVLTLRRSNIQGDEAKAFDLNPGEISAVLDLPAAMAVMKLESKGPMPIETVRSEIEATLRRERTQTELSKVTKKVSAQFNLQYFEMSAQPDIFGPTALSPAPSYGTVRRRPVARR